MDCIRSLFFSIMFLIMGTFMVYQSLSHCGMDSRDWPTVEGLVVYVKTAVINNKSKDVFVKYEYEIEDTIYSSTTVVCDNMGTDIQYASKYIKGKKVTVFYNSSHPNIAVLEPGISKSDLIEGVVCIFLGLMMFLYAINYARRHQDRIFAL